MNLILASDNPKLPGHPRTFASAAQLIEQRAIEELIPWPGNPRTHSPEQIVRMAAGILKSGINSISRQTLLAGLPVGLEIATVSCVTASL